MTVDLNKDTLLCMSLSGRPSNIGTRFHNYLYEELGLNFVYKAFTTEDVPAAIGGIRALGIRGCGVSMPFKEQVIEHIDVMHDSASAIDSVNTIVNESGVLHAYNTDYQAVADLLRDNNVDTSLSVAVAGSGGMAKAVVAAVRDTGFTDVTVIARNQQVGSSLAKQYGFDWQAELGELRPGVLINATPIGMSGGAEADALSFPEHAVRAARCRLRRRRDACEDATDRVGDRTRQNGDHRSVGHCPSGRRAVRSLHRCAPERGADPASVGILTGVGTTSP